MHRSLMEILVRIISLLMVITVTPARNWNRCLPTSREPNKDMSRDMLWGYFFTNPLRAA